MPGKRVEVLIHTRLQPGDQKRQKKAKPFKRFPDLFSAQHTWLKPGVNENRIGPKNHDSNQAT